MQLPNNRRVWSKLDCGVVDMGSGLADDFEEFRHEAEAVSSGVEKIVDINGFLNLTLS